MTDKATVNSIKSQLLDVVAKMNHCGEVGIKIEFAINTHPITLKSELSSFTAWQVMKDS